ncbi:type II secretion system protein GspK [Bradyrhizobium sp. 170]|uniref:type II secretion system protein GspK n=1 Tax=Bradyrhizobium sp. 170 TaxID=2782641 RepID=UPI001FFFA36D|nr:type II secretion system protein GspK [Bradyrhizobium sp. 170]UPK02412.1 general secretion pathway protein GspK [Bradyrhizobium sp. 170]
MANRPKARTNRRPALDRPECPSLPRARAGQSGFALVAVIWTLGLITLLGMAVIVGARYRTKTSSNYASVTAAEMAAESAVNLVIATALAAAPDQAVNFPLRCRLPGGERATITVEEETGKIDLNTASPAALTRLFTALTGDQSRGMRIAAQIVEFRKPKAQGMPSTGPAETRFTTIMQLDQIDGMSPRLFRAALRHVTVRSGRPEPDMEAASPAMLRLLNVEPKQTTAKRGLPVGGSMTIRADISASDGARFIREALVSLEGGNGRPYVIREWRRGDIDSSSARQESPQGAARACLRVRDAAAS